MFRRGNDFKLSDDVLELIRYYMNSEGINDLGEAISSLIKKGYRYWNLEKSFGKVDDREFWDIRYRLMKVESRYLHYRLLLRDAMEHIRTLIMNLSGALSQLDACFMRLKDLDPSTNIDIDKLRRYRDVLNEYVNKFLLSVREELEDRDSDIKDEDVLNEVEELVRRYRELLRKGGKLTNLI